ncbi:hypothetical protein DIURU_003891 [Diutina rugosa]|uniref:Uncharacterized protein n=1 Tax=Diutina rugosa TaxID=5481 RepID=A0A642UJQ7_DIURU|nr:uncharacterized protein DIURU_003891 [Diutina rugosa]KAA8900240.1 hypothetical protein DIURU_003891 [Diutina rugosa]
MSSVPITTYSGKAFKTLIISPTTPLQDKVEGCKKYAAYYELEPPPVEETPELCQGLVVGLWTKSNELIMAVLVMINGLAKTHALSHAPPHWLGELINAVFQVEAITVFASEVSANLWFEVPDEVTERLQSVASQMSGNFVHYLIVQVLSADADLVPLAPKIKRLMAAASANTQVTYEAMIIRYSRSMSSSCRDALLAQK